MLLKDTHLHNHNYTLAPLETMADIKVVSPRRFARSRTGR